jgi:uncharacterized membrane protein/glutaredoxin
VVLLAASAIWLATALAPVAVGQTADTASEADDATVTVVMYYSPTCPHCHRIITEVLPPLEERYGDSLEVVLINTSSHDGNRMFWEALEWLAIPEQDRGVPIVVVGSRVLVGGDHVTQRLAKTIEDAFESGGAEPPDLPGLDAVLAAGGGRTDQPLTVADMSIEERLALDPAGATVALLTLAVMIASVLLVADLWRKAGVPTAAEDGWPVWLVPALVGVGLVVATYLAYVELTDTSAICGPIGSCNTVQQSPYAKLFGVLPIGVLGVVGYLFILGVWLAERKSSLMTAHGALRWIRPLASLFGVLFSIYLTFLEPFVIGAVCMWCVTSAWIMTALLWTTVPASTVRHRLRRTAEEPPSDATGEELQAGVGVGAAAEEEASGAAGSGSAPGRSPTLTWRIVVALSYLVAMVAGVAVAAGVVHVVFNVLLPPPMIATVAEVNRRASIENAVLVSGIVVGPLAWHAIRSLWRSKRS